MKIQVFPPGTIVRALTLPSYIARIRRCNDRTDAATVQPLQRVQPLSTGSTFVNGSNQGSSTGVLHRGPPQDSHSFPFSRRAAFAFSSRVCVLFIFRKRAKCCLIDSIASVVEAWTSKSEGDEEPTDEKGKLVARIKELQRTSPESKKAWRL